MRLMTETRGWFLNSVTWSCCRQIGGFNYRRRAAQREDRGASSSTPRRRVVINVLTMFERYRFIRDNESVRLTAETRQPRWPRRVELNGAIFERRHRTHWRRGDDPVTPKWPRNPVTSAAVSPLHATVLRATTGNGKCELRWHWAVGIEVVGEGVERSL